MSLPENDRINLIEIKISIAKRIGPERTQTYFNSLQKLLSNKLSKAEFNKICVSILGLDNVALHNELIRSILKNAVSAKAPPLAVPGHVTGSAKAVNQLQSWSNGEILQKTWSSSKHNKVNIRSSIQNSVLDACDLKRAVQQHYGDVAELPLKRPRTETVLSHYQSFLRDVVVTEEDEDMQLRDELISDRGPLCAPLGVPLFPANLRGRFRSRNSFTTNYDSGELCQTEALRQRMEKIAELQGVEGVTLDGANLLNHGLDEYLKRLIKSSLDLVGTKLSRQSLKQLITQGKPINGVWMGNHMHIQSSEQRCRPVSLQDFKVAMELNPQQLGEDWPLLLEKICLCSFEE